MPITQYNPHATQVVIVFNFGNLKLKKSLSLLTSDDSISKADLLITPELYDSIMQGIHISELLDRKHHYATVLFLNEDLNKNDTIGYENLLGFSVYCIKDNVMYYKLFVQRGGIFTPVDAYTCTARRIYCNDNNAIARQFIKLNKKPVTWIPVSDQVKDAGRITSRHELSDKVKFPIE